MSEENFTFADTLKYEPPNEPDCLLVPEAQWDTIHDNLKKSNSFRDNLLWTIAGLCGGGGISCWVTYLTFPDGAELVLEISFLVLAVILSIVAVILIVLANKLGSDTTVETVKSQMDVLKKGFRKFTSNSSGKN